MKLASKQSRRKATPLLKFTNIAEELVLEKRARVKEELRLKKEDDQGTKRYRTKCDPRIAVDVDVRVRQDLPKRGFPTRSVGSATTQVALTTAAEAVRKLSSVVVSACACVWR